jgi:hypothetical protein
MKIFRWVRNHPIRATIIIIIAAVLSILSFVYTPLPGMIYSHASKIYFDLPLVISEKICQVFPK